MSRFDGLDGRSITGVVREAITRAGVTMDVTAAYDHQPPEYRARILKEQTFAVQRTRDEGRQALTSWAKAAREDANKRLNARSLGSAAEESRRVAEELRVGRLVDTARRSDTPRNAAADLTTRADLAWQAGDHDEALVLARAAVEVDPQGQSLAVMIVDNVETDRLLEDPAKARAYKDLGDIDVVTAAFERDVAAAVSRSLQDAAALARVLGDNEGTAAAMQAASADGRRAKLAAFAASQANGVPYTEPYGVVPGLPQNLDSRGVAQPEGATLPEAVR